MSQLSKIVAAHPLRDKYPYNAIKFSRINDHGVPLYRVAKDEREYAAAKALSVAFTRFGGHCFHCKDWMEAQPLSHHHTRDHLRPKKDGGGDYLHNLVFACGPCNRKKGGADLISFSPDVGSEYIRALDEHLTRCLRAIEAR